MANVANAHGDFVLTSHVRAHLVASCQRCKRARANYSTPQFKVFRVGAPIRAAAPNAPPRCHSRGDTRAISIFKAALARARACTSDHPNTLQMTPTLYPLLAKIAPASALLVFARANIPDAAAQPPRRIASARTERARASITLSPPSATSQRCAGHACVRASLRQSKRTHIF